MGVRTYIINHLLETEKKERLDTIDLAQSSELIYERLMQDTPCMIARFGKNELDTITRYISIKNKSIWGISFFWNFMGWNSKIRTLMKNGAGFFSNSIPNIEKFCELMIDCTPNLDILASWVEGENIIKNHFQQAKLIPLHALEPYYHKPAWSRALAGKKILVIHPYSESISSQYEKRHLLFEDKDILPDFELKTIKSVQSIANENVDFKDWFEALDHMKQQIFHSDFDIAIIGCGAYGFPLASFVKDIGKKAIHMGGATQILFGIKGRRWDNIPTISSFYNDHWVKPSKTETPKNAGNVEGGCYW